MNATSFDAVLMIGFGGPTKPDEIRPFLQHVLRGRPVPPSRIEEVAHHYEVIGGRSPINELTERQRVALEAALHGRGVKLPVVLGMRHAEPFVADVLAALHAEGKRKLLGVITASFHDRDTVARYSNAVSEGIAALGGDMTITYCEGPSAHTGFIAANVAHVSSAFADLPAALAPQAELVFTAHSVPTAVGHESGYVKLYEDAAAAIARGLDLERYRLAYQSRSGAPRDPWLEPDICDVVRELAGRGVKAMVIAPIGFVCDHVEVLYDLDVEAAQAAREHGIALARASTVTDHPAYIQTLAQLVIAQLR